MKKITALALMMTALSGTYAQAAVLWSVNASGCVPEDSNISELQYNSIAGKVLFQEDKTGTIRLICPITDAFNLHNTEVKSISITYRDTAGPMNSAAHVTATLRSINRVSDDASTSSTSVTVSSKDCEPEPGLYSVCLKITGRHTFNFDRHFYWVQLSLKRDSTEWDVRAAGVCLNNESDDVGNSCDLPN